MKSSDEILKTQINENSIPYMLQEIAAQLADRSLQQRIANVEEFCRTLVNYLQVGGTSYAELRKKADTLLGGTSHNATAIGHVSEVRPNPGNEKGACCEICGAILVCLSCGNHRRVPPAGVAAQPAGRADVVTEASNAYYMGPGPEWLGMTAALRTFAAAYREQAKATLNRRNYAQHGTTAAIAPDLFDAILAQAERELLGEREP